MLLSRFLGFLRHEIDLYSIGPELEGSTLVVGGDGRFFMTDAVDIIIKESILFKIRFPER